MPSRKEHNLFAELIMLLSKGRITKKDLSFINRVNKAIDLPHVVYGKRHRKFFHSIDGLILSYLIARKYGYGIREALLTFLAHIILDSLPKS